MKQNPEIKQAKEVLKINKQPKIEVKGSVYKFHYLDGDRIVELVDSEKYPKQYSFLVFDNLTKTLDITNAYTSRDGLVIYPPSKEEKYLKKLIIPKVASIEEVSEEVKNFNAKDLDKKIDNFLRSWFIFPDEYFLILRLFIKFSWVHETQEFKTYLSFWGDRGTGKTEIGKFLSWLCRFPYFNMSGVTPAVLARSLDLVRGIAIIDESDMYFIGNEETASFMRIMKGYDTNSTYDIVDENRKTKFPRQFDVGFPKVILSSKPIKDDHISSRCIIMELKPTKIPREMIRDSRNIFWLKLKDTAQEIVNDLLIFRICRFFDETKAQTIVEGVEPRYNDVAMPLFYMTESKEEDDMFYNYVVKNVEIDLEQRSETNDGQILSAIKKLTDSYISNELLEAEVRIYVNDIVEKVKDIYYENSSKFETEKFINNRKIGWSLKGLGIKTKKDSAQQGKKYIIPDNLKLLPQLYARFGIKDDSEVIPLTKENRDDILPLNNDKSNKEEFNNDS